MLPATTDEALNVMEMEHYITSIWKVACWNYKAYKLLQPDAETYRWVRESKPSREVFWSLLRLLLLRTLERWRQGHSHVVCLNRTDITKTHSFCTCRTQAQLQPWATCHAQQLAPGGDSHPPPARQNNGPNHFHNGDANPLSWKPFTEVDLHRWTLDFPSPNMHICKIRRSVNSGGWDVLYFTYLLFQKVHIR